MSLYVIIFTAAVLQVCSVFFKVSLSAFADVFTTHAERSPASLEGSLLCSLQPAIQALKRFIHPAMCVSLSSSCVCVCIDWLKWRARTAPSSPTACPRMRACEYAATSSLHHYCTVGASPFSQLVCVYVHAQASACVFCVCARVLQVMKDYIITLTLRIMMKVTLSDQHAHPCLSCSRILCVKALVWRVGAQKPF